MCAALSRNVKQCNTIRHADVNIDELQVEPQTDWAMEDNHIYKSM